MRLKEAQEEEARAALDAELADLRASHERARQLLAEIKYELAWRRLCRKYGYNPISRATNWGDGLILEHQFGSLAGWDVGEGDSRQAFLTRRLHSTRVSLSLRHGRRTRFKEFNGLIRIGVPLVASGPG